MIKKERQIPNPKRSPKQLPKRRLNQHPKLHQRASKSTASLTNANQAPVRPVTNALTYMKLNWLHMASLQLSKQKDRIFNACTIHPQSPSRSLGIQMRNPTTQASFLRPHARLPLLDHQVHPFKAYPVIPPGAADAEEENDQESSNSSDEEAEE